MGGPLGPLMPFALNNPVMTLLEILDLVEKKRSLQYRAQWNPENMWYDIVDMRGSVVAKDVSPNPERAKAIAATYQPGQIIEHLDT